MLRGLAEDEAKARALILAGRVLAPGLATVKAGEKVSPDQPVSLAAAPKYVSRGGDKLEEALRAFGVSPRGRACVDVGASTGGFTDCLLQHGAPRVWAIDVGHGQLDWKLRNDPRIVNREKTHIRDVSRGEMDRWGQESGSLLVTVDVSFISLEKVLPVLSALLPAGAEVLALVKPQFEADPREAPGGVVRDSAVRERLLTNLAEKVGSWGFVSRGTIPSPIPGRDGNIEYFFYLVKEPSHD